MLEIDYKHWPLVLLKFQGAPTRTDIKHFLTRSDIYLDRREHYAMVYDTQQFESLGHAERRLLSDWIKANTEFLREYCLGQAYILNSLVQRMVLRSVFMLQRPPFPFAVFSSRKEAVSWSLKQLNGRGIQFEISLEEILEYWSK